MASGDVVLDARNLRVKTDDAGETTQETVLHGTADSGQMLGTAVPEPWPVVPGVTTSPLKAADLAEVLLHLERFAPNVWQYPQPADWPPETVFDTSKRYRITITEE